MSSNINFEADLLPLSDGDYNLGSTDLKWNGYFNSINLNGTDLGNKVISEPQRSDHNQIWLVGSVSSTDDQTMLYHNDIVFYDYDYERLCFGTTSNYIDRDCYSGNAATATTASKVTNSLTLSLNGISQGAYDGSAAKAINITPSSIGAATSFHTHTKSQIWTGTCSTAAETTAKIVVLDDATDFPSALTAGTKIAVTFTVTNTATTPTLTIQNSSGTQLVTAKTCAYINYSSTISIGSGSSSRYGKWAAYETVIFTYNGTYWIYSPASAAQYGAYYGYLGYNYRGYVSSSGIANNSTNYPVLFKTAASNSSTAYSNSNIYVRQGTAASNTTDVRLYAPNFAITGTPTNNNDAVTKEYVDDAIASVDSGGSSYTLPTATSSTLGGVKIGSGLTISSGTLSVNNQVAVSSTQPSDSNAVIWIKTS
jgi:hypothetical protein